MSSIKLKHASGNAVSIAAPESNPASDRTLYVPSNANGTILTNTTAGCILQVVKGATLSSRVSTTSTTYADTGTTVNITPSATSSKIWVIASGDTWINGTGYNAYGMLRLVKDSTELMEVYQAYDSENSSFAARLGQSHCMQILDSPSTTSQITYKVQYKLLSTNYSAQFYYPSKDEAGFYKNNQITVMEVAG